MSDIIGQLFQSRTVSKPGTEHRCCPVSTMAHICAIVEFREAMYTDGLLSCSCAPAWHNIGHEHGKATVRLKAG